MDRILSGAGGTLSIVLYDSAGAPSDAGGGNGTVAITNGAGAAIAGSPFTATHGATGNYSAAIPVTLTPLDTYRAVWTFPDTSTRTTYFEVVGGFLFTVADVLAFDQALAAKTAPAVVNVREIVEERFERVAGVSFTRRGTRVSVDGSGTDRLLCNVLELQALTGASIDGTALSAPDVADVSAYPIGLLVRDSGGIWTAGNRNIDLWVEHGYAAPPAPVHRAALTYAKHLLLNRALETERATGISTDVGFMRMTIAGRDGSTGLPDVDEVLAEYGRLGAGMFA